MSKNNVAETVSYALTQETTSLLSNQTFKVEIEEHTWMNQLVEKVDEKMQKALKKPTETRKKNGGVWWFSWT